MKKIQRKELLLVQITGGDNGWNYYAARCGVSALLLEASFLGGPAIFGANVIYFSVCSFLLPLYAAG